MYKLQTDLFNAREYKWKGLTSKWKNSNETNFIEFVTSPSNPDCLLHDSVLGGSSVIYDHAYYWPHFTAIPAAVDKDVMIFTMSKISGHASSRFGYSDSLSFCLINVVKLLLQVPCHTWTSKLHDRNSSYNPNNTSMVPCTMSFPP
jgi:Allinase